MKSIVFLITTITAFFQFNTLGLSRPDLNQDAITGVSQKELLNYMTKAIEGFREMMPHGDEQMEYPVLDPYQIEDASWEYVDHSSSKKYKLNLLGTSATVVKGLSNFDLIDPYVNAQNFTLGFELIFNDLQIEFPYKLEGYLFKNFLPIWGEGKVKLNVPRQAIYCIISLGIEQSYIVVEDIEANREANNINIEATGLLDLPGKFGNLLVDDIMHEILKKHGAKALKDFVRELVEEAVGGMTLSELFDYLDHFVKKKATNSE